LSQREIEILKLLAGGKQNAEIARDLFISPNTVRNHISNILAKLQMSNRIEAAAYAIRNRMV
jgi:DNA-binding NarL/FixJ family response regulator